MSISEVESEHRFLDLSNSIFPHLKDLNRPSLTEIYERCERFEKFRTIAFKGAMLFAIATLAIPFVVQPIMACLPGVISLACYTASVFLQRPPPYLILSIDGGGIRGMIPIQILNLIEREIGIKIGMLFDCVTGTSIGGILALALTQPDPEDPSKPKRSVFEALQIIEKEGPFIFEKTALQSFKSVQGVRTPKYSNTNLKQILNREFKDTRLDEAVTDILIPSYDLLKGKPAIFFHFKGEIPQKSLFMKDVGMGTAAAPVYFPSYSVQNNGHTLNLVDGGLIANNPALLAYMKAADHIKHGQDIFILSIGTGQLAMKSITPEQSEYYGMFQWLPMILDIIFKSTQDMLILQFKVIKYLGNVPISLIRLQPELEKTSQEELDNGTPLNIQDLKRIATNYFNHNHESIQREIIKPLRKYRALLPIPAPIASHSPIIPPQITALYRG